MYLLRTLEGRIVYLLFTMSLLATGAGLWKVLRNASEPIEMYLPGQLIFPYSMLFSAWSSDFWGLPIVLAALQYPIYAGVLTIGVVKGTSWTIAVGIVVTHLAAVVLCVALIPRHVVMAIKLNSLTIACT